MIDQKSNSGQVILTCAILLAIILVIIALMLNNIIYATNVAYIGFMDGSKYEDLSIRQLTTKEAQRSYQDNQDTVNLYMIDYNKHLNLLTNSKGKYVEIRASALPTASTLTAWDLIINDRESAGKYSINTMDPYAGAPVVPTKTTVIFNQGTAIVSEGQAVILNVILAPPINQEVKVDYAITGGTATPADFAGTTSGTLTFPANSNGGPITILTAEDAIYEDTETFIVTLTPATSNAVTGTPATATVSIMDDDSPTSGSSPYKLEFTSINGARPDSNKKDVHITVTVKNTGTNPLTDVKLTLDLTPTKNISSGSSPVTIGNIASGGTATYVWIVDTQNQNDKITVCVKATSTDFAGTVISPQLKV